MRSSPQWYEILEAARYFGEEGFTSEELAESAEIVGTEASSPTRIASAWLGKFQRWGYVVTVGTTTGKKRWSRKWALTSWGHRIKPDTTGAFTRTGKPKKKKTVVKTLRPVRMKKVANKPKKKKAKKKK